MSVSTAASALFATNGVTDEKWYGRRKARSIRERATAAGNAQYAQLVKKLPAGSRIVWAQIKNNNAYSIDAGAATNVAICGVALVFTAPSSLVGTTTGYNVALHGLQTAFGGSVSSNTLARGLAAPAATAGGVSGPIQNTSTSDATLYLVPYASTVATAGNTNRYAYDATAATSGFQFNGTSTTSLYWDVEIFYETFDSIADR